MHNKLKDLRLSENLTQNELAKMLDVSRSCVSGWERGLRKPSTIAIAKYHKIFKLKNNYFSPSARGNSYKNLNCFDISILNAKGVGKLYDFYLELIKDEENLKNYWQAYIFSV